MPVFKSVVLLVLELCRLFLFALLSKKVSLFLVKQNLNRISLIQDKFSMTSKTLRVIAELLIIKISATNHSQFFNH